MRYYTIRNAVMFRNDRALIDDIVCMAVDESTAIAIRDALNTGFGICAEPEQPTPAAEVIIELSKRVSALEEWKDRHDKHPFERHQPRDTTNVTPIPEFDAGL